MDQSKLLKRKTSTGFVFFTSDYAYKSETYETREERDEAIEKYIELQKQMVREREERIQKEKEWFNQ